MENKDLKEFKKGTVCYRCGIEKKVAKKYNFTACSSWGANYEKHMWNGQAFKCLVHIVSTNPC